MKQKAFTLIELLVVIAIISLLSSVVFASLNSAREKARDAKRFTELRQLQTAIELYRSDNPTYPSTTSFHTYSTNGCRSTAPSATDWSVALNLGKLITGGYIKSLPVDPSNSVADGLCYTYSNVGGGGNTAWTCTSGSTTFDPDGLNAGGGVSGPKYAYLIVFKSEINNYALPLLNNVAKTYCLLGPIVS